MSEQAEPKSPTAIEESEPEAGPPPAPEASKAEAAAAEPSPEELGAEPGAPKPPAQAADTPADEESPAQAADEPAEEKTPAQAADEPAEEKTPVQAAAEPPAEEEAATETQGSAEVETKTSEPGTAEPAIEAAKAEEVKADEAPAEEVKSREAEAEKAETEEPQAEGAKAEETQAQETKAETAQTEKDAETKEPEPLTAEELARQKEIEGLRQAKETQESVKGRVIGWNQGGFHVVVGTITTFCPRSEMELKNPKSPNYYLDKEFEFHVIKHQKKGKRIVLSRKQLLEGERARILEEMKDRLVPGKDLEGRVSSITDFGAFVDLGGGIEGLVHITELSTRRVKHPRDLVELGQEVGVRVLKVEQDGERISLSMKALEPNPYKEFAGDHPRGSKFQGKVVRKTDFGVFVELLPGLDGMIHVSQLPPGIDLETEALEVGREIEGWVLRVEPKRERISLSLKEVPSEDPWKNVGERYSEGAVVEGQVEDVAPFGVFIQLEPGLTGLLPNSEMNLPRGQDRSKHYPPGKKVEIQIASVDPQRKRISLAPQGAHIEGSRSDYKNYLKEQKRQTGEGMTAMAAAFAKLKEQQQDEA